VKVGRLAALLCMDNLHRGSWATGPGAAPYVSRTRIRDNRRNSQLTIRPEREIGWRTVPLEIGSIGPAASATGRARTHPMSARCASSANLRKRWIWCYLRSQSVVGPTGPLFPACQRLLVTSAAGANAEAYGLRFPMASIAESAHRL